MTRPLVRTFTYACVPVPLNGAEHSSQAFRMEHDVITLRALRHG